MGGEMSESEIDYHSKIVKTIRGAESRAISKWTSEGWELVEEKRGRLQTQITFRRPKRKLSRRAMVVLGGSMAVLFIFIGVMAVIESGNEQESIAPVARESEQPNEEPIIDATAEVIDAEMPSGDSLPTEVPSAAPAEEILTVDNSKDLAELLAGSDSGPVVEKFAAKYKDQLIEFDASVWALAQHGNYKTRYDILIAAGNFDENRSPGPSFQFRDVNTTNDLHYTNESPTGTIGIRDNIRVVARVGKYSPDSLLFQLEPIETSFR